MASAIVAPPGGWPLVSMAEALGRPLDPAAAAALGQWLDLLSVWNAKMDLTAAKTAEELAELMVADAMALAAHLPPKAHVVDVGTGAGAPGLGVAILRPDLSMTLADSLGKRTSFLRTVLGTLRRADVTVLTARGEELPPRTFDAAISRATLPPPEWLTLGARLVKPGGEIWVLLARDEEPEIEGVHREERLDYALPFSARERHVVRYRTSS